MLERVFRRNAQGELVEIPARDPARRYRYRSHRFAPELEPENIYVEFTDAEEAARTLEENAPPFNPDDWYWLVDGRTDVYHSARFAYVPTTDPAYVAFLAAGGVPQQAPSEAALRERLHGHEVAYLAEPLPPLEERRPRVHRARLRLLCNAQVLVSGTAAALQWSGTGDVDPLNMHNPAQAAFIVIPAGQGGLYRYTIAATIAASPIGTRALQLRRGAPPGAGNAVRGTTIRLAATPTAEWEFYSTRPVLFAGGDVLRVFAQQDSGGSLAIDAEIALERAE